MTGPRRRPASFGQGASSGGDEFPERGTATVPVDVVATQESLRALYAHVRAAVAEAVRDGYADAMGQPPPGGDDG